MPAASTPQGQTTRVLRFIPVASSERSSKRPSRSPANPRPRKRVTSPAAPEVVESAPLPEAVAQETKADGKNVGSLEGALSLTLGVLLVISALFPRSFRQLLMLGIGGGLLYRGTTGQCGVYKAMGISTAEK